MRWPARATPEFKHKLFPLVFPFSLGFPIVLSCLIFAIAPLDIAAISFGSQETVASTLPTVPPLKCKNEQGKDVDWFIVYKLPKNRTSSNPLVRAGLAYAYILPGNSLRNEGLVGAVSINNAGSKFEEVPRSGHSGDDDNAPARDKGSLFEGHANKNNETASWTLSNKGIDSPASMVGQTISKLYIKNSQDVAYLTYNDQPPTGPTVFSGGHTKGIITTSLASGFWIQHSVPHFPLIKIDGDYRYPDTGKVNGQVFHCVSLLSAKDVDNLGKILEVTKPHVVNYSFPTPQLKNELPQLEAIVNHHKSNNISFTTTSTDVDLDPSRSDNDNLINLSKLSISQLIERESNNSNESPCVNEIDERACLNEYQLKRNYSNHNLLMEKGKDWDLLEIRSAEGVVMQAFVKGPSFNEDVYSAWIAPKYNTKLEVQSWLNGRLPYPSNCTLAKNAVFNIIDKTIAGHTFSTHNDHSKWAVSTDQPLVCISDLNRMEHQLKRGGVTVCFTDSAIWATFNSSVIDIQPCPRLFDTVISNTTTKGEEGVSTSLFPASIPSSEVATKNIRHRHASINGSQHANRQQVIINHDGEGKGRVTNGHYHNDRHRQMRKVKSRTFSLIY